MSVRVMADVWDSGPADVAQTSVLLILANFSNDQGLSCHPSIERISKMSRLSERTVKRVLVALEEAGWLTIVRIKGRPKNAETRVYSDYKINISKLKGCQDVTLSKPVEKVRKTGGKSVEKPVQKPKKPEGKGDICAGKGCHGVTKRVTLTTEKGDIDDNLPSRNRYISVSDPSLIRHKNQIQKPPLPLSRGAEVQPVAKDSTAEEPSKHPFGELGVELKLEPSRLAAIAFASAVSSIHDALMAPVPLTFKNRAGWTDGLVDWDTFHFAELSLESFEVEDSGALVIVVASPDPPATRRGLMKYEQRWERALRKAFGRPVQMTLRGEEAGAA